MAYIKTQKIISPSIGINNNFGNAVVTDGYYAAISEPGSLKTWLYKLDLEGVWQLSVSGGLSTKGSSLAMYGNSLLIGDTSTGEAYLYDKDIISDTRITTFNGVVADNYGCSVAINEDYIVVGASYRDSNIGSIYVYEKINNVWTSYSNNPIELEVTNENDYFGCSVAINNNNSIIVGASGDTYKKGAIYIFEKNEETETWEQVQKIFSSDGVLNDEFGSSVSVSGNYFVAGARLKESLNLEINAGAAYVFKYSSSWNEVSKLVGVGESSYEGNHFGESVSISGDYIAIGSPLARGTGVVDIFYSKRGWGHLKKIEVDDINKDNNFGFSVSIFGNNLIIGSSNYEDSVSEQGASYLYKNPSVKLRLAQEFEVNKEYLPSKASVYLKRVGKNLNNYWLIYNNQKTVIDATNFSNILNNGEMVFFKDGIAGFTGNGYMGLMKKENPSSEVIESCVINYPLKAIDPDTFDLWIRCISPNSDKFRAEILIDGEISKTIEELISNPSSFSSGWDWIKTKIVLPDRKEHILGIKIKENEAAIDKLYIEKNSSIPYLEGPDYSISPYLTIHMRVRDYFEYLYVYDYKNSITEVIQDDWYNFNIKVIDNSHGYFVKDSFVGNYFLVLSVSGTNTDNFIIWELIENDEYISDFSSIRI